jgi:hypothetical protein
MAGRARGQEVRDVPGSEGAVEVLFDMPLDGQASVILYRSGGEVLRPLAQLLDLKRGRHRIRWDGLDLWGRPVPAGTDLVARVVANAPLRAYYEFGAAAPNAIPWLSQTFGEGDARRTGGWLGDHSPPWCAAALGDRVYLGCPLAEHGHTLIYTNLDGEKMWGGKVKGWSGVEHLTTDGRDLYALTRGRQQVIRFDPKVEAFKTLADLKGRRIEALAVRDGKATVTVPPAAAAKGEEKEALPDDLVLQVYDVESGALVREMKDESVRAVGRLAFDPAGKLYSLVGPRLCRTELRADSASHMVLNDKELKVPISLAVDGRGERIAVGDEARNAVVVFDPQGKVRFVIGDVGPRRRGPWDPHTVDRPMGLAFDRRGKLWVVENYFTPKRVSRFGESGAFEKAFYGPPHYGGGGFLDPNLKSFFYEACEFALDWAAGASRLANLNDVQADPMSPDLHASSYTYTKIGRPIYCKGRRYVVGDVGWQYNPGFVVCLLEGPVWRPCAVMGPAAKSPFLQKEHWRKHWEGQDLAEKSFIWCDRSGDGQYQVEEVELVRNEGFGRKGGPFGSAYWGNRCGPDLTFWGVNARLAPSRFTETGVPIYEAKDLQPFNYADLAPNCSALKWGETNVSQVAHDGSLVIGGQPYRVGPDLKLRNGPAARPTPGDYLPPVLGERYGGLSFVGNVLTKSPLGEVGVLNGNDGRWYVVSLRDSLLVGMFFTGEEGSWSSLYPKRGMDVTGRRHDGETFFGDFIKAHDGNYYAVAGKGFHAICRIEGLDDYRVAEVPVKVTAAQADQNARLRPVLKAQAEALKQAGKRRPSLQCRALEARTRKFQFDGDLADWGPAAKMPVIGKPAEGLRFDIAHDAGGLYVAYSGLCVLGNASEDPRLIFTTGFALDLRVRPDARNRSHAPAEGDRRVVFGRHKGQWAAMLYDYVNPKAGAGEAFVFASPVTRTRVARCVPLDASKARIAFKAAPGAPEKGPKAPFTAEVFVAWEVLGIAPAEQGAFLADVGILGADSGGIQTARRAFWSTQASDELTDVAVEARMPGDMLGTVQLQK